MLVEVLSDLGEHGQKAGTLLAAQTGAESGEQPAGAGRRPAQSCLAAAPGHLSTELL